MLHKTGLSRTHVIHCALCETLCLTPVSSVVKISPEKVIAQSYTEATLIHIVY